MAWKTVYDALTEPMGFDRYCDDAPRPAGINRFDLYPLAAVGMGGRFASYRSDRRVPVGSRMGPQNMVVCGWALQALAQDKKLWTTAQEQAKAANIRVSHLTPTDGAGELTTDEVRFRLHRELAGGLRTWEAIFDQYGYVPTGIGCQSVMPGVKWDAFSDTGGYAHLISAASQWILVLEGKRDWNEHRLPIRGE